jgi:hypothetical protein
MKTTTTRVLGMVALAISMPALAGAQARVGVATTVVGPVTVTRAATSPAPLKFRDDVMLNDRVATGDQAFARMLLGGKAVVTAREHSIVTITEAPGVSTIDLASGRISVAVEKSRMRPGEVVEIKTPNAVSGIRGTIVVAEVSGDTSTITVLRGLVDVYRRDPATGKAVGRATALRARESVTVKAGLLPARPRTISMEQARMLSTEFTTPVQAVSPTETMVADEVSRATDLAGGLTGKTVSTSAGTTSATSSTSAGATSSTTLTTSTGSTSLATPTTLATPTLSSSTPTLSSSTPTLSAPTLSAPTLSAPTVSSPTVSSPTTVQKVLTPILSAPNTLLK